MSGKLILKADGTLARSDEIDLAEPWDGERGNRVALAPAAVKIERARLIRTFGYVRDRARMRGLKPGRRGLSRRKWRREVARLLADLVAAGGAALLLRHPIEAAFDVAVARWAWSQEYHGGLHYETCLPDPSVLADRGWRYGVAETPARLCGARRARLAAVPSVGDGADGAQRCGFLLDDGMWNDGGSRLEGNRDDTGFPLGKEAQLEYPAPNDEFLASIEEAESIIAKGGKGYAFAREMFAAMED